MLSQVLKTLKSGERGGCSQMLTSLTKGGVGVSQLLTIADKGGRGVQTPLNMADIICEQSLWYCPFTNVLYTTRNIHSFGIFLCYKLLLRNEYRKLSQTFDILLLLLLLQPLKSKVDFLRLALVLAAGLPYRNGNLLLDMTPYQFYLIIVLNNGCMVH